jgi:hypothetical protein
MNDPELKLQTAYGTFSTFHRELGNPESLKILWLPALSIQGFFPRPVTLSDDSLAKRRRSLFRHFRYLFIEMLKEPLSYSIHLRTPSAAAFEHRKAGIFYDQAIKLSARHGHVRRQLGKGQNPFVQGEPTAIGDPIRMGSKQT